MTMLRTLLICLLLSLSLPVHASDELPDVRALESQLGDLEGRDALTQRQSADKQALEKALGFAAELDRNASDLDALNKRLREAPAERNRLQQRLNNLTAPDTAALEAQYANQPVTELVGILNSTLKEMEQQQNALAEVTSELISFQTLPERAQTILARDLSRAEQVRQTLASSDMRNGDLSGAEQAALTLELAALESRMELSRRELWSADGLQALSEIRQRLLEQENVHTEQRLALLQDQINSKRKARTEQMIADALGELPDGLSDSPALRGAIETNRALADQLLALTESTNQLIRDNPH
jgi:potassium efflux system protein